MSPFSTPPPRHLDRKLPAAAFKALEKKLDGLLKKHGFGPDFAERGSFDAVTNNLKQTHHLTTWRNILCVVVKPHGDRWVGDVVWVDGITLGTPTSQARATIEEAERDIAGILALVRWVFPRTHVEPPKELTFRLFALNIELPRDLVETVRKALPLDDSALIEVLVADTDARLAALLPAGLSEELWTRMSPATRENLICHMVTLAAVNRFVFNETNGTWMAMQSTDGGKPS